MNSNPEGILSDVYGVPVRTACFGTVAFNILFHGIWSSIDVYQFTKEEKAPDAYPDAFYYADLAIRLPQFVAAFILLVGGLETHVNHTRVDPWDPQAESVPFCYDSRLPEN